MPVHGQAKEGFCKQCGKRFPKKPADKLFCKPACAYRYHNRRRGRVTGETAQQWLVEHLLTVREAEAMGAGKQAMIRSRIRRGRLAAVKLFGRVLLGRSDVLKLAGEKEQG